MPQVGLIFELRSAETRPGETVRVAGAGPCLGAWRRRSKDRSLELRTSNAVYPLWTMLTPVWVEVPAESQGLCLEYKYVRDRGPLASSEQAVAWEDQIPNRSVEIPCEPGTWIVSDACWGTLEPPQLRRAIFGEVQQRCSVLDPDPLVPQLQSPGPFALQSPAFSSGGAPLSAMNTPSPGQSHCLSFPSFAPSPGPQHPQQQELPAAPTPPQPARRWSKSSRRWGAPAQPAQASTRRLEKKATEAARPPLAPPCVPAQNREPEVDRLRKEVMELKKQLHVELIKQESAKPTKSMKTSVESFPLD